MTPEKDRAFRSRQQGNARVTAIALALFVALVFAITIAKMLVNR